MTDTNADEYARLKKRLECPIGMTPGTDYCSAGTCYECVQKMAASLRVRVRELEAALNEALSVLDNYADPTGYLDPRGDRFEPDEDLHPGLLAKHTAAAIRARTQPNAPAQPEGSAS